MPCPLDDKLVNGMWLRLATPSPSASRDPISAFVKLAPWKLAPMDKEAVVSSCGVARHPQQSTIDAFAVCMPCTMEIGSLNMLVMLHNAPEL
jgi:hypothetical protein